jgi:hypothetical protein
MDKNAHSFCFLNHDYTEEDEEDEFKVSLFHLIHLVQCNHGSETTQQILNNEELIFQSIPKKETHGLLG